MKSATALLWFLSRLLIFSSVFVPPEVAFVSCSTESDECSLGDGGGGGGGVVDPSSSSDCLIPSVPTVKLHNGVEMPLLQLGTAQLITQPGTDPTVPSKLFIGMVPERAYRQIQVALEAGLRAFDSALIYRSHHSLRHVLAEWWRTGQLPDRSHVWITTKIFHPPTRDTLSFTFIQHMATMTPEQVARETRLHFETSLIELGVGYVDLMLLHWPGTWQDETFKGLHRKQRAAAWGVLEEMYQLGWARAIGVSNFSVQHLRQLEADAIVVKTPMVNQIEASVTLQYEDIRIYCLQNGIVPQAYSPFGGGNGIITKSPPSEIKSMATKYNKSVGQIAIRYLIQLGYAVVYLSNSKERMVTNTHVFDFELTKEEMKTLDSLNRPDGGWGLPDPNNLD